MRNPFASDKDIEIQPGVTHAAALRADLEQNKVLFVFEKPLEGFALGKSDAIRLGEDLIEAALKLQEES